MSRRAGIYQLTVNGNLYEVAGAATYNIGGEQRETLVGHDSVHGFKAMPLAPFVEVDLRDAGTLNVRTLKDLTDASVIVSLANGKTIVLSGAWWEGSGDGNTEEATIAGRFGARTAEEVLA